MKLEDRLRKEMHDTAEHLVLDPGAYEEVIKRGEKRRGLVLASGTAAAVAVAVVVAGVLWLRPQGEAPVAATTLVPVTRLGDVVMVSGPDGITIISNGGTTTALASDLHYKTIAWAVPDGDGGLLFVHEVTPLPWDQGSLMWLPAGASVPQPLVAPDPGGLIRPIGAIDGLVVYRLDSGEGTSQVVARSFDSSETHIVVPDTAFMVGASVHEGAVAVAFGGDCNTIEFYDLAGTRLISPDWVPDCMDSSVVDIAYTGAYLFTVEDDSDGRALVRRDYENGNAVRVPIEEGWQVGAASPAWVAIGGQTIRVGDFSGENFKVEAEYPNSYTFALGGLTKFGPLASLGSGLGELPCTPLTLPEPASQGLPDIVEAKGRELFNLAAGCDLERLGEIAIVDHTSFTFGDEEDPVDAWVRSARHGFDVMSMMVRMFNAPPTQDPTNGTYAWPAVHVTNTEEDWQQLSGILSAAEFEQYYAFRDSGYLGLRIGITESGVWEYVIAGD